jgi:hypothetical protein
MGTMDKSRRHLDAPHRDPEGKAYPSRSSSPSPVVECATTLDPAFSTLQGQDTYAVSSDEDMSQDHSQPPSIVISNGDHDSHADRRATFEPDIPTLGETGSTSTLRGRSSENNNDQSNTSHYYRSFNSITNYPFGGEYPLNYH